ncbi:MAG: hypothetical protein BWY78_01224 [Alphaproteobacteria bacterium ADurb.Bin438]|nr:MAG: hypothetical protein BWY78_01224 [Alphaproteobacteria bacterium ADurb.Bin438]
MRKFSTRFNSYLTFYDTTISYCFLCFFILGHFRRQILSKSFIRYNISIYHFQRLCSFSHCFWRESFFISFFQFCKTLFCQIKFCKLIFNIYRNKFFSFEIGNIKRFHIFYIFSYLLIGSNS